MYFLYKFRNMIVFIVLFDELELDMAYSFLDLGWVVSWYRWYKLHVCM